MRENKSEFMTELRQELHRNLLRILFWGSLVILGIIAICAKHEFNGADMAAVIAGVFVKATGFKPVGR